MDLDLTEFTGTNGGDIRSEKLLTKLMQGTALASQLGFKWLLFVGRKRRLIYQWIATVFKMLPHSPIR